MVLSPPKLGLRRSNGLGLCCLSVAIASACTQLRTSGNASSGPAEGRSSEFSCSTISVNNASFNVCVLPPSELPKLKLFIRKSDGTAVGNFATLDSLVRSKRHLLRFAMNAGMYEAAGEPTGLLIIDGQEVKALNLSPGPANPCTIANFYCPPNGVFFVSKGRAQIISREDFGNLPASDKRLIETATQSGPMLVRDGALARPFSPASTSRLTRNGVGIRADGTVVLSLANNVNFFEFASAFANQFRCTAALFLDGAVSQMYVGKPDALTHNSSFGAIFGLVENQ